MQVIYWAQQNRYELLAMAQLDTPKGGIEKVASYELCCMERSYPLVTKCPGPNQATIYNSNLNRHKLYMSLKMNRKTVTVHRRDT